MKIKKENKELMKKYIKGVLKAFDIKPEQVQSDSARHQVWFKAWCCVNYPSNNSNALIYGKRLFKRDDTLKLYPNESNDNHLTTTLRSIFQSFN